MTISRNQRPGQRQKGPARAIECIHLPSGIIMDARLNQVGYDYLQAQFREPISELIRRWGEPGGMSEADAVAVFSALVIQHNPGMTAEQAKATVQGSNWPELLRATFANGTPPQAGVFAHLTQTICPEAKG